MKCTAHPKYEAKRKPQCDCLTCWIMWEAKQSKNEVPAEDRYGREPDKVKPLAQYLDEYIEHEVEINNISPEVDELFAYDSWRELLQQALDAYESTEQVKIRIEPA